MTKLITFVKIVLGDNMECIFCKIIKGEIPCFKIYEDNDVLAFLDINPDSDGHTLIIPKKHFADLDDIDLNTLSKINEAAKHIKNILENKLKCDGISLLQNNGCVQDVKHYHLHLKPNYKNKQSIEILKHKEFISNPKDIYEKLKEN